MQVGDALVKFILRERTIIEDLMLVLVDVLQEVEQFLRIGFLQLLSRHIVAKGIVLAVHSVLPKHSEATALLRLLVLTVLQDEPYHLLVSILVNLRIVEQVFEQSECLGHILAETAETNGDGICIHADGIVASHLVELLLNLSRREFVRAEIVDVACCHVVAVVVFLTELIAELQVEEFVLLILLVDDGQALRCVEEREVFLEVEE